jgi:hypothetical protein
VQYFRDGTPYIRFEDWRDFVRSIPPSTPTGGREGLAIDASAQEVAAYILKHGEATPHPEDRSKPPFAGKYLPHIGRCAENLVGRVRAGERVEDVGQDYSAVLQDAACGPALVLAAYDVGRCEATTHDEGTGEGE